MRVLLADDHALIRAGIRALLQNFPDIEVIGEARDGAQVLEFLKAQLPDILLMDISMPPGSSGLETAVQVARDFPSVRVIILSIHPNEEYVTRALQAGVVGYLLKNADPEELAHALRRVAAGETYLTPVVSSQVLDDYKRRLSGEKNTPNPLTPRQRETLQMIAEGRSTKEIARDLNISTKTVETHRAQLMERLNIHDIAGLVRYAMRTGMIGLVD